MLRLVAVTLSRDGEIVLASLNAQARAGELVIIEGGRGAGKTLLLEVAAARRRPDSGEVWIAERDVTALQRASIPFVRRNIGFVDAHPTFIENASVLDNVMFPLIARSESPAYAREAALRALGKVGIVGLAATLPSRLSNSARRLAGIARALSGSPPLVLIDDPSASLSAADSGAVLSALLGCTEGGAAVVCATADGAFVAAASREGARRLRLDAGSLVPAAGSMVVVGARGRSRLAEREVGT